MKRSRIALCVVLCIGCAAFIMLAPTARADDEELRKLRERVERLEAMNAALMQRLEKLTNQTIELPPLPPTRQDEVRQIVNTIMSKQDKEQKAGGQNEKDQKKQDDKKGEKNQEEKTESKEDEKKAEEWYEVGTDLSAKVYWKDNLTFESPNNDFLFQITGRLQWDNGWFTQSGGLPEFQDVSSMRRARIGMQGRLWETMFFRVAYDFASPSGTEEEQQVNFRDAYIRLDRLPYLRNVQIGQMKEPIGLEWSATSNSTPFLERPLNNDTFIHDRNVGIMTFRTFADDRIFAGTGVFRQLSNRGAFSQGDGQYAWTSRATALPYWDADGRCLVHVGGGYSHRAYAADQSPRFRTRTEVRLGTPHLLETGSIIGTSDEDIFNGEFAAVFGPFSVQSEVTYANVDGPGVNPQYWGMYVMASYFLTGENRKYDKKNGAFDIIQPFENFFIVRGDGRIIRGLGAWEVLARWSYVDLHSSQWFNPINSDRSGGTGTLHDLTLGVNWYWNPYTTIMFNYIRGWRHSDTAGGSGIVDTAAVRVRWWF